MKRPYTLLILVFMFGFQAKAQDLAVTGFLSPGSGACNACNPLLTVVLQNTTPMPFGANFDVSYSINGGPPLIENNTTFFSGSTSYNYTFSTNPPICSQGVFSIKVELDWPSDINPANDTLTLFFTNDTTVVPGTMLGSTTVCMGNNSGAVQLTGYTGYIDQWQYSTNGGGGPWTNLPDTLDVHSYSNLDSNTIFQVLLDGGYCPDGVSPWAVVNVDEPSDAGFMSSLTTIACATGNTGIISLTGYNGNILDWESSTGTGYTSLSNANDSLTFLNLAQTTFYQAIVQNGACPADTSAPFAITVDVPGTAGVVLSDTSVCRGTTGVVTLTGFSGDIAYWLSSPDGGNTWTPLSDTDAVHNYTAIDTITYTVVVQNGVCPADTAVAATITVLPVPVALAGPDDTAYVGETLCFNATGGLGYIWTPSTYLNDPFIGNPCATPTSAGTVNYTVTVTNAYGCLDNDVLTLTVIDTLAPPVDTGSGGLTPLVICNFVTPNSDGDNDVWNIIGIDQYPDNAVTIINNHGQIVFEQVAYNNTWTGESLPDGAYYYMVRIGALDKLFKGVLTITSSR